MRKIGLVMLMIALLLAGGCAQGASPTATPVPATLTPIPPTATHVSPTLPPPSPTMVLASATPRPVTPTASPVSPTSTPIPPTATPVPPTPTTAAEPLALTSAAFGHEEAIPVPYTCDGQDISPPLAWNAPPAGTQSLALICDDPDAVAVAGFVWVHWVVFNLPADARELPEAVPASADLPDGSRQGNSSWKRLGYGGPCPPSGTHRYVFKLYALDVTLDLAAGATAEELGQVIEGHVLAQAELVGTYARP